jgi:hypothetical protein
LWVKAAFVDRGPTKNRRRMRPAPQGRAYREKRHFCHVTVLLSSDEKIETKKTQGNGKAGAAKSAQPAESKNRRRGGAAAAPRALRTVTKVEATAAAEESRNVETAASDTTATTTTYTETTE